MGAGGKWKAGLGNRPRKALALDLDTTGSLSVLTPSRTKHTGQVLFRRNAHARAKHFHPTVPKNLRRAEEAFSEGMDSFVKADRRITVDLIQVHEFDSNLVFPHCQFVPCCTVGDFVAKISQFLQRFMQRTLTGSPDMEVNVAGGIAKFPRYREVPKPSASKPVVDTVLIQEASDLLEYSYTPMF